MPLGDIAAFSSVFPFDLTGAFAVDQIRHLSGDPRISCLHCVPARTEIESGATEE
jgi:hypothetical protein